MPADGKEDPEVKWHLDKRLNVSHLLTTITLAAGLVIWASAMDRRVAVLEEKAHNQRNVDERQDAQLISTISTARDEVRGLREDLRELSRKTDRLVEALNGRTRQHSLP